MIELIVNLLSNNLFQSIFILIITIFITKLATSKGVLIYGVPYQHYYSMPRLDADGKFPVITQQIWFENSGGATLEAVEVIFNWRPQHFEVWDPRSFSERFSADGKLVLEFPYLAARDSFRLSMIETFRQELPMVAAVRHKTGSGKLVVMQPRRILTIWLERLMISLLAIGVSAVLYLVLQLAIWLISMGGAT